MIEIVILLQDPSLLSLSGGSLVEKEPTTAEVQAKALALFPYEYEKAKKRSGAMAQASNGGTHCNQ